MGRVKIGSGTCIKPQLPCPPTSSHLLSVNSSLLSSRFCINFKPLSITKPGWFQSLGSRGGCFPRQVRRRDRPSSGWGLQVFQNHQLMFDLRAKGTCSLSTTRYPSSTWSRSLISKVEPWRTGGWSPTGSQPCSTIKKSWRWVSKTNISTISGWWLAARHHWCGARDCPSVVWQLGHHGVVLAIGGLSFLQS